MKFISTRDNAAKRYTAAEVIKAGIAPDGGLFFPEKSPFFDSEFFASLADKSYAERAAAVISPYLEGFTADELSEACRKAYSSEKFPRTPAPLRHVKTASGEKYFLELYHGPTCAFKDLALQLMPRLLSLSIAKTAARGDALILVATSGDTGKAALEGFADVPRTRIKVFYPDGGVSDVQRRQMLTQRGDNVGVYAVKGNFDDCQTAVKKVFTDPNAAKTLAERGQFFSSANSINFGRLVPQVAYYVSACVDLRLSAGRVCDIVVPTGNFGNILAAYMAKKAGAPIGRLICASNRNKVLTDFFETGVYDRRREFYLTSSPSMDILVSSNLERLLMLAAGTEKTSQWMRELRENGVFTVDGDTLSALREDFDAFYAEESDCFDTIARLWKESGCLIDTHTAAGAFAAEKYAAKTGAHNPIVIAATASPFKFAPAVCDALGLDTSNCADGFACIDLLSEATGLPVPAALSGLRGKSERFGETVSVDGIPTVVLG